MTGWSIKNDTKTKNVFYDISFKRLEGEHSMDEVLRRPWTEEVEDYKEYKRLRQLTQAKMNKAKKNEEQKALAMSGDGVHEVFEDETAETPFQSSFTDRIAEHSGSSRPVLANSASRQDSAVPVNAEL